MVFKYVVTLATTKESRVLADTDTVVANLHKKLLKAIRSYMNS